MQDLLTHNALVLDRRRQQLAVARICEPQMTRDSGLLSLEFGEDLAVSSGTMVSGIVSQPAVGGVDVH